MYFDEPAHDAAAPVEGPRGVSALLAANGALVLVLGMLPDGLMAMCRDAIVKALGS
jgi:NADH-quinone oxidoreductase subunit N